MSNEYTEHDFNIDLAGIREKRIGDFITFRLDTEISIGFWFLLNMERLNTLLTMGWEISGVARIDNESANYSATLLLHKVREDTEPVPYIYVCTFFDTTSDTIKGEGGLRTFLSNGRYKVEDMVCNIGNYRDTCSLFIFKRYTEQDS